MYVGEFNNVLMPPPELTVQTTELYMEFYAWDNYLDNRGFQIRYRMLLDDSDAGVRAFFHLLNAEEPTDHLQCKYSQIKSMLCST